MRYRLTVRDGRVLTGEIVGEAGPSILFRNISGSGLQSIPLDDLTGAFILDDGPLEIDSPIVQRCEPYYEMNESEGDLVVSIDNAGIDRIRAEVKGQKLIVNCSGPERRCRFAVPLPVPVSGQPSVRIYNRIAEITLTLS